MGSGITDQNQRKKSLMNTICGTTGHRSIYWKILKKYQRPYFFISQKFRQMSDTLKSAIVTLQVQKMSKMIKGQRPLCSQAFEVVAVKKHLCSVEVLRIKARQKSSMQDSRLKSSKSDGRELSNTVLAMSARESLNSILCQGERTLSRSPFQQLHGRLCRGQPLAECDLQRQ